ncbi:MAG: hypothetical protein M0P64_03340 [Candidatus Pacebacteria bacterium]|jgi:phosphodiesterase/alkaline phosphatase D-like protein|nr:hypothetical protein [Candidatus Paceibacterota bacterium]
MKNKIKMLGVGMIALVGLFVGANIASAQTAPVTTCTTATIYGTLTSTGGAVTSVWFEWGPTQTLGYTTASQSLSAPQTFSQYLSGLTQNTTYYYRAVFANAYGSTQGSVLSFVTPSCQANNVTPTVTTNNANVNSQTSATLNGFVNANGSNGTAWFEYGTTQSFGQQTSSVTYGNTSMSFTGSAYGLAQNTTYYYRAVAQSAQGGAFAYGSTLSFTTMGNNNNGNIVSVSTRNADVSGSYASLNGYVDPNYSSDTVRWFEYGTTQSLGYTTTMLSHGTVASIFSAPITNLTSNTTYYYRAVARNSQGTVYGSTLSFTTSYQPGYTSGVAPAVTTLLATETTASTARLNGLVFASNGQSSNAWFEWGSNSSLGNKTQTSGVGALPTVKHSDYISGLTAGQTYYYRIVAENSYGKEYGTVNTFVAEASTYVAPVTPTPIVYKPVTTVVTSGGTTQSLVMLTIEGGAEMIMSGEKRTYRVTWKNTSAQALSNVVLRVTFPKTMNVESATKGTFSSADNSVVVDLKTLAAGESGDTFIFATAGRGLKSGDLLVVPANMVYTNKSGVQGDALAYVTHRAEVAQNAFGASVFGAGSFTPTTLLGWVSLLGLVLVLVLLGNHLYGRFTD